MPEQNCAKCGYSLRGLISTCCPECGKEFDPNPPYPPQVMELLKPVDWPARSAKVLTIVLIVTEALLWPPPWFALFWWLCIYVGIMGSYWKRDSAKRHAIRRLKISGQYSANEPPMLWRARRWLGIGLVLTLLQAPQFGLFAIEFPLLSQNVHRLYEKETANGPHNWHWCLFQPIWDLEVNPAGIEFYMGTTDVAYDGLGSLHAGENGWHHVFGRWWIWENPESPFNTGLNR
jgi:hypothetical protein